MYKVKRDFREIESMRRGYNEDQSIRYVIRNGMGAGLRDIEHFAVAIKKRGLFGKPCCYGMRIAGARKEKDHYRFVCASQWGVHVGSIY